MLKNFKIKKNKKNNRTNGENGSVQPQPPPPPSYSEAVQGELDPASDGPPQKEIVFHCQLAHGSPTGLLTSFSNVTELYQKIASCFDIPKEEVLFCTLNSHKMDMTKLMGGRLMMDDFIFAHVKGRPKVVDIEKTDDALGLTITDNGAGYAFIKNIKENSLMSKIEGIFIGDHIEKIDNCSVVGCRHFEVAQMLKAIPKGTTFALRVVEPLKSGFSEIGGKSSGAKKKNGLGSGRETLRLRSKGQASIELSDETVTVAVSKINSLLESYLGISDTELAQTIWEVGNSRDNPSDFTTAIDGSDLNVFGFTESMIFDFWGAISDAKQGRLQNVQNFNEQF